MNEITKLQNMLISVLAITSFVTVFALTYSDNKPVEKIVIKPIESNLMKVSTINHNQDNEVLFWERIHFIESASGRIRYQGKDKNCLTTKRFCGHFQIGYQALKDISCTTNKCLKDRDDYKQSLVMAKKILDKKMQRYKVESDWLKYAMYQQGASGIKSLILASKGKKKLSKIAMKRIARNTIYSMKDLRVMGSRKAAISYLNQWRVKWEESGNMLAKI